jgi:hypothetical protein
MDLLKDKVNEEKKLSQQAYDKLSKKDKIDWFLLSSNPNIFVLI